MRTAIETLNVLPGFNLWLIISVDYPDSRIEPNLFKKNEL